MTPGCVSGEPEPMSSGVADEATGDGEQAQPQAFGFPAAGWVVAEGQHLQPGGERQQDQPRGGSELPLVTPPTRKLPVALTAARIILDLGIRTATAALVRIALSATVGDETNLQQSKQCHRSLRRNPGTGRRLPRCR